MSAAIAGSEVAITVESMFSMNRATATISGTMRLESMSCCGRFSSRVGVRYLSGALRRQQVKVLTAKPLRPRAGSLDDRPNDTARVPMIYILAVFLPPLALLVNGQPLSALLNLIILVPCLIFGLVFWVLL